MLVTETTPEGNGRGNYSLPRTDGTADHQPGSIAGPDVRNDSRALVVPRLRSELHVGGLRGGPPCPHPKSNNDHPIADHLQTLSKQRLETAHNEREAALRR